MAKALGLIGNFKGKLGNTVGYSLKDSNNKQTQGVRVYQPVVRNPKTAAQAEQRAKLAPINATYRALKMVIDRGQEGIAYGNKSRLAWLSATMMAFNGPWYDKGENVTLPVWLPLTKGSLAPVNVTECGMGKVKLRALGSEAGQAFATIGAFSTAIKNAYSGVQDGDQITVVAISGENSPLGAKIVSIIVDPNSDDATPCTITPVLNGIEFTMVDTLIAATAILSREGANGAHLRSTSKIVAAEELDNKRTSEEYKQAAIESYMSQGANTDWAEESLM